MELRVKRIRPGEFSIHSENGALVSNAEHRETRYQGDEVLTHVVIRTKRNQLGKFTRISAKQKEEHHGSDSSPA